MFPGNQNEQPSLAPLEKRLAEKFPETNFSCHEIILTLRNMNMMISLGDGYIPVYERTDLTDALHEISGFRTDLEIVSNRNMKKNFNLDEKKKNSYIFLRIERL